MPCPKFFFVMKSPLPFPCSVRALGAIALAGVLVNASTKADIVFEWNVALSKFSGDALGALAPQIEARAYAITHVAMNEAVIDAGRGIGSADVRVVAQRAAAVSA